MALIEQTAVGFGSPRELGELTFEDEAIAIDLFSGHWAKERKRRMRIKMKRAISQP